MSTSLPSTEITVYNQGFGLVKEARTLNLQEGRQTLAIEDVAATIDPSSVSIRSLDAPDSLIVLEQNYRYDLLDTDAILARSTGERVRVVGEQEIVEGVLISSPGDGGMILRTDDGRIVLDPRGQVSLYKAPEGLVTRPTLVWDIESAQAGRQAVELSYVAQRLSWSADYVLTLGEEGTAELQGWVTLTNESGATYPDVRLKLLAGDVNRPEPPQIRHFALAAGAPRASREPEFQEQRLFEYHLYTLGRPTTLANREVKQVALLKSDRVAATKRLVVDATRHMGRFFPQEGEIGTGDIAPQARIEFLNEEASGLGIPLSAGRFRVMARDQDGSVQLLGEDRIDHTPKNEKISLVVGRAFDIRATRTRTAYERLGNRGARESFAIELRNRKDVPETIEVIERFWGQWKIGAQSDAFKTEDANTVRFTIALAAEETRTLTYTVETRW